MGSRKAPTARQRRVGAELRRMREHAGLTIAQSAAMLGTDRTNISNLEGARFGVSGERIRQLAANYGCRDGAFVASLAAMAEDRTRGWWAEYRGVLPPGPLDLAEVEYHARRLVSVEHTHIPGLLQTEEHARAVLRLAIPQRSDTDLLRRLTHRMKRKAVFERDEPTPCLFLVHEAALRMRLGGPDVQRRQLARILEDGAQDHITVRVIPFTAAGYPGAGCSATYAVGPVPRLDTVQFDSPHGIGFLDGEAELARYRATLERMQDVALPPDKSREFIRAVREEL